MTVTPDTGRWDAHAATRTRGDVGDGIASVLALLGVPDLISFAGGFPDPKTFPRERVSSLLQEFAAVGEVSAFQYAPTRGLAGTRDALAERLERLQGRRPADDELLITSGWIEALELTERDIPITVVGGTILATMIPIALLLFSIANQGAIAAHAISETAKNASSAAAPTSSGRCCRTPAERTMCGTISPVASIS